MDYRFLVGGLEPRCPGALTKRWSSAGACDMAFVCLARSSLIGYTPGTGQGYRGFSTSGRADESSHTVQSFLISAVSPVFGVFGVTKN